MYMKLIGRIFRIELSNWMRNCRRKKHFDLDCVKNNNRYQQIKTN